MSRIVERPMFLTTADLISLRSPLENYAVPIGSDAPFRLHGIAVFPIDGILGSNFNQLKMRFTRPDQSWAQRNPVPTFALAPGQPPTTAITTNSPSPNYFLFSPIYPNLVYPPNSVILIDIQRIDGTTEPLAHVIVFIGTSLYEEGRLWMPPQASRSRSIPYIGYNVPCNAQQLVGGIVRDVPLNIGPDADFVWQQTVHTDIPVGQSLQLGGEGLATVLFLATTLGTASGQITINVINSFPTANVPFSVSIVGNAVTVTLATDAFGTPTAAMSANFIASVLNANLAFLALGLQLTIQFNGAWEMPGTVGPTALTGGGGFLGVSGQGIDGNLINLGVRFKDWTGKYFSNADNGTRQNSLYAGFIPAAILAGFNNGQRPGLLYPEIYIPRNGTMYFDFALLDGGTNPNQQTPIVTLKGQKVY